MPAFLLTAIPARAWAILAAVAGVLALVWWLRSDAASDALRDQAVRAAQQQETTRERAEDAARDASRDDVLDRMRRGDF